MRDYSAAPPPPSPGWAGSGILGPETTSPIPVVQRTAAGRPVAGRRTGPGAGGSLGSSAATSCGRRSETVSFTARVKPLGSLPRPRPTSSGLGVQAFVPSTERSSPDEPRRFSRASSRCLRIVRGGSQLAPGEGSRGDRWRHAADDLELVGGWVFACLGTTDKGRPPSALSHLRAIACAAWEGAGAFDGRGGHSRKYGRILKNAKPAENS